MTSHRPTLLADGGQHLAAEGKAYDQTRGQALQAKAIRIIRFSDVDILAPRQRHRLCEERAKKWPNSISSSLGEG